jgi:hypothetical protein
MDAVDILNRLLHGTVNSVVQYIDIAAPYVSSDAKEDLATLRRLRDEEVAQAARLRDAIAKLDGVPKVGVFPYWNVDLNYLDLRFLARFAAGHQERVVAEVEADVARLRDHPEARALVQALLAEKRAHLETLRAIGARAAPKPSAERVKAAQPKDPQHVPRAWSKS